MSLLPPEGYAPYEYAVLAEPKPGQNVCMISYQDDPILQLSADKEFVKRLVNMLNASYNLGFNHAEIMMAIENESLAFDEDADAAFDDAFNAMFDTSYEETQKIIDRLVNHRE